MDPRLVQQWEAEETALRGVIKELNAEIERLRAFVHKAKAILNEQSTTDPKDMTQEQIAQELIDQAQKLKMGY